MAFQIKLAVLVIAYFAQVSLVESTLYQFCDLREDGVYKDPQIIDESQFLDKPRIYPAAAIAQALARDPARKAALDGARHAADLNRQADASRGNRTKRMVGAEFLAATKTRGMCSSREQRIQFSISERGTFCYVVEPQDLRYYDCANSQCDFFNPLPFYQTYRCEPDTYVYLPAVAFCDDGLMEEQTFYVPINCCCRRYNCNLKKKFDIPRLL